MLLKTILYTKGNQAEAIDYTKSPFKTGRLIITIHGKTFHHILLPEH